jgi:hypothetical protein
MSDHLLQIPEKIRCLGPVNRAEIPTSNYLKAYRWTQSVKESIAQQNFERSLIDKKKERLRESYESYLSCVLMMRRLTLQLHASLELNDFNISDSGDLLEKYEDELLKYEAKMLIDDPDAREILSQFTKMSSLTAALHRDVAEAFRE